MESLAGALEGVATALRDTRADPCATLPHALALRVFGGVSVEERLRCREVCRGWCATLDDHSLWLRLDLTRADGAACSLALLRAATARAAGQLQALRLTCVHPAVDDRMHAALCAVAAANSATLQELRVRTNEKRLSDGLGVANLEALLRAAPQLQVLDADAFCFGVDEAHRLLRSEPPFEPLRVSRLGVDGLQTADAVVALAADVAAHIWLTGLRLQHANLRTPAALDAVVDAVLARRLSAVELRWCLLSPTSVPALVRLLGSNAVEQLLIDNHFLIDNQFEQLLDEPAATLLLSDALRANTSLISLNLIRSGLWDSPAAAAMLLTALTGHPRLHTINLSGNFVQDFLHGDASAAYAALGALAAANAPALQQLDVSGSWLGDEGMGPLVEALFHNTHLRVLNCADNGMSHAFARDHLLPALRANTGLRTLTVEPGYGYDLGTLLWEHS
jgi:hypothetical protein